MDDYFEGAVRQLHERARHLVGMIPRDLGREVDALAVVCRQRIMDEVLKPLQSLIQKPEMRQPENQPMRLRRFRQALRELDVLETVGIAALRRWNDEDRHMNQLTEHIAREIRFPLTIPVVTCSSQHYYHTYPHLNLLLVPLAENRFLLHLPDLYHELAHPLLAHSNDPQLEPFQHAYIEALNIAYGYVAQEIQKAERSRGPSEHGLWCTTWLGCWENWLIELFCDLFAVYTVGPAFGWAHLHLCIGRGGNPVEVPRHSPTTHPADAARMSVILNGLKRVGFAAESDQIEARWNELLSMLGTGPTPEYRCCFPDRVLNTIAGKAYEGTHALGCHLAEPGMLGPIRGLLNSAWIEFWRSPQEYVTWEKKAAAELVRTEG